MNTEKIYRPCVGVCLFNKDGNVFVGERIDTPGAWQMPQGGIDEGEDIKTAAIRELYEETGIKNAKIIRVADQKIRYDLPPKLKQKLWHGRFDGQEQTWIAMRYLGENKHIDIKHHPAPEFSAWKWVGLSETLSLIVPFKKETYKSVIALFADIS